MANQNTVVQYSFASGVVAPGIRNRKDWQRIDSAIAEGKNGFVTPTGGFRKRPGLRFINECLHDDKPITLVTFEFSKDQVYCLEFGDYLMRFYQNGGLILNDDDSPYVLATPYSADEAAAFSYAQERDAMFFAHWDKPLKKLTRYAHNNWVWSDVFVEEVEEGEARIASPEYIEWYTPASNGFNGYEYAVTAYKMVDGTPQESISYSTIQSRPEDVNPIEEAPNRTLQSVYLWLETYFEKCGGDPDFPNDIPDEIDFRDIKYDNDEPHPLTWWWTAERWIDTDLNTKITNAFRAAYGNANIAGTTAFATGDGTFSGWGLRDPGTSPQVWYAHYSNGQFPGYYQWDPSLVRPNGLAGNYGTWYMKEMAMNHINNGVTVGGYGVGDAYQPVMDFIEDWNERYTQKVFNHFKWPAVADADGYYVYRRLIDSVDPNFYLVSDQDAGLTDFIDEDVTETTVYSKTPIEGENEFTSPDNYPNLVTFFQQRLVLGCTKNKPTTIFGSRTGIYTDFSINASDNSSGYEFKMASQQSNPLEAILPLYTMAVLTSGGDFISTVTGAMNASNVNFNQKSYNGCSDVAPVIVGDNGVYVPLNQQTIKAMTYSYEKDGFRHENLLFHAQHYTQGKKVVHLAYQRDPINMIWALLDDGTLLSCLYIPEQQFLAWSEHNTAGQIKFINTVPTTEGNDQIYCVARRALGDGAQKQYLEVLEDMRPYNDAPTAETAFYLDSGLTGIFPNAVSTLTGLDHLEGLEVAVLADYCVQQRKTVVGGAVTLDRPAGIVHVGLPYGFRMTTLDLEPVEQGTLRDTRRQVCEAVVEVENARELWYSANGGEANRLIVHEADEFGVPKLTNGDIEIHLTAPMTRGSCLTFTSDEPVPCCVLSVVAEIDRGD